MAYGSVEPTTKVINATRTIWNFLETCLKCQGNVGEFYFGGLLGTLQNCNTFCHLLSQKSCIDRFALNLIRAFCIIGMINQIKPCSTFGFCLQYFAGSNDCKSHWKLLLSGYVSLLFLGKKVPSTQDSHVPDVL